MLTSMTLALFESFSGVDSKYLVNPGELLGHLGCFNLEQRDGEAATSVQTCLIRILFEVLVSFKLPTGSRKSLERDCEAVEIVMLAQYTVLSHVQCSTSSGERQV